MNTESPTYFFSYARKDGDFVLKLAKELRDAGARVWIDQLDILGGQRWDQAVEQSLRSCKGMIVVLSPTSVNSNNVMDEVSYALGENKLVVPVLLSTCEIPFRLRRLHHIDIEKDYKAGFENLLRALSIQAKSDTDSETSAAETPTRRPRATRDHGSSRRSSDAATSNSEQKISLLSPLEAEGQRALNPRVRGSVVGLILGLLAGVLLFGPTFSSGRGDGMAGLVVSVLWLATQWAIAGAIVGASRLRMKYAIATAVVCTALVFGVIVGALPRDLAALFDPGFGAVVGALLGSIVEKRRKGQDSH